MQLFCKKYTDDTNCIIEGYLFGADDRTRLNQCVVGVEPDEQPLVEAAVFLSIHYEKDFLPDPLAVLEPTRSKQANSPTDCRLALIGLFPGLKKCPPDTFLPRCRSAALFESAVHTKKHGTQKGAVLFGAGNRTRTCTLSQWNLNPPSLPIPPCPHVENILPRGKIFVNG